MMDQLVPALTVLLAGLGAFFAALAKKHSKQANEAVNQAHTMGTPRIYDMVFELHAQGRELIAWKRSYDGGPLDNGVKVKAFVERVDVELNDIRCDVHSIRENCEHCQGDSPPPAA